LTEVSTFDDYDDYMAGTSSQIVEYAYDAFNRLIVRTLDADGSSGTGDIEKSVYAYDGDQIALQFDKTSANGSASALSASDLSHRYLWNSQAVDQLFADEKVTSLGTAGSMLWALTDHENSIRDLATYDSGTDTTTVANHRIYDSYGNLESQTNSAVDCLFGWTGRYKDSATGLQNNLNRWYDPTTGTWISKDPISFAAGDANLYRYVFNNPLVYVDPTGLSFWSDYWYYLTHPSAMDSDLQTAHTVAVSMIAVGGGGLAGIGVGTLAAGTLVEAGMGCEAATVVGSIVGSEIGGTVGGRLGRCLDGETAGAIGQIGGSILGGMTDPVCFAAGTPLLTPNGTKPIEQFQVGDLVLSSPEDDPNGPVVAKRVEKVFERSSVLFDLHVAGKLIRTTAEHPFYVRGKGWTAAKSLVAGDLLRSHDGQWLAVESANDSGEVAPVYNMRVEEYHTYFVGSAEWGFSVWVHNTCDKIIEDTTKSEKALENALNGKNLDEIETAEEQINGIQKAQKGFWKQQRGFNNNPDDWNEPLIPGLNG
jgi:RHS repeat-associated protein